MRQSASALAHHDLIDAIPHTLAVAIPRASRTPPLSRPLFDAATFNVGRAAIGIARSDLTIGLYSPERRIFDAFRLRQEMGYETGGDALKDWFLRGWQAQSIAANCAAATTRQSACATSLGDVTVPRGGEVFKAMQAMAVSRGRRTGDPAPTHEYLLRHVLGSFLNQLSRTEFGEKIVLKGGVVLFAYCVQRRPGGWSECNRG